MIQIDMPMPTNCLDCPACNEYLMCAIPVNGRGWGENDVKDFSQSRPEWCPMKEQEEEHRRLLSWLGKFCRHIDNGDAWLTDEENIAFFKEKMKQQFGWDCE